MRHIKISNVQSEGRKGTLKPKSSEDKKELDFSMKCFYQVIIWKVDYISNF